MSTHRAPGQEGWDINDPFATLPMSNTDLQAGELCVVYYHTSYFDPNSVGTRSSGRQAPVWGSLMSPKKPEKAKEPSTSSSTSQEPEKKETAVYLTLLGAVRLASQKA